MKTCLACHNVVPSLDHGACPECMLAANQALLNAADDWRNDIADQWLVTHFASEEYFPALNAYNAANRYIQILINEQEPYSQAAFNAKQDASKVKAQYRAAYRFARMEDPLAPFTFARDHESDFPEKVAHAAFSSWCWYVFSSDVLARREYWVYRGELPTFQYYRSVKIRAIAEHRTPPEFKPFSY